MYVLQVLSMSTHYADFFLQVLYVFGTIVSLIGTGFLIGVCNVIAFIHDYLFTSFHAIVRETSENGEFAYTNYRLSKEEINDVYL